MPPTVRSQLKDNLFNALPEEREDTKTQSSERRPEHYTAETLTITSKNGDLRSSSVRSELIELLFQSHQKAEQEDSLSFNSTQLTTPREPLKDQEKKLTEEPFPLERLNPLLKEKKDQTEATIERDIDQ